MIGNITEQSKMMEKSIVWKNVTFPLFEVELQTTRVI